MSHVNYMSAFMNHLKLNNLLLIYEDELKTPKYKN